MTQEKKPRITISPDAYQILMIQAAIEGVPMGELASKVILSYSKEAAEALLAVQNFGKTVPSIEAVKFKEPPPEKA
jgi:ABC-type proline/glycine betaine transport system permease subunit